MDYLSLRDQHAGSERQAVEADLQLVTAVQRPHAFRGAVRITFPGFEGKRSAT